MQIKPIDKKAQINKVSGFVLGVGMVGAILGLLLLVLSKISDQLPAGSAALNAVLAIITELSTIPGWVGILIVAGIGGLALFMIIRSFQGRN